MKVKQELQLVVSDPQFWRTLVEPLGVVAHFTHPTPTILEKYGRSSTALHIVIEFPTRAEVQEMENFQTSIAQFYHQTLIRTDVCLA